MTVPLAFCHGPLPMRSRALTALRAAARIGAEISAPGLVAGAGRLRPRLAMGIRAGEPAEIAALAGPDAGDEEGHVRLLGAGARAEAARHENGRNNDRRPHLAVLPG